MTCHRAQEVDLLDFLANPRSEELRSFRDHYPACPDCAAEVRVWTELEITLTGPESHPEPEVLVSFGEDPGGLGAERRAEVERHLERCGPCRDELRAVARFDPARVLAAPTHSRTADVLARLRRIVWQPAFAYALVLVMLVPLLAQRWSDTVRPVESTEYLAPSPPADRKVKAPPLKSDADKEYSGEVWARSNAPKEMEVALDELEGRASAGDKLEEAAAPVAVERDLGEARPEPEPSRPEAAPKRARQAAEQDAPESALEKKALPSGRLLFQKETKNQKLARLKAGSAPTYSTLEFRVEEGLVVIDVPNPFFKERGPALDVRVVSGGGRELRERVSVEPGTAIAVVRVPKLWLGGRQHVIEVREPSDPPSAERVFRFLLRPPYE